MFSTAERQALVDEWKSLSAEPDPPDRRSIGCMTVIVVILLTVGTPPLVRWLGLDIPRPLQLAGAGIALVLLAAGVVMGLFLGSGRHARACRLADAAVEWLAGNADGDPAERRRQAVVLLYHAYCVDGPSTTTTIDFGKARERLGAALPYVMEVERCLAIDLKIYRVFTDDKVRLPG
jgi:hypothetical protein